MGSFWCLRHEICVFVLALSKQFVVINIPECILATDECSNSELALSKGDSRRNIESYQWMWFKLTNCNEPGNDF